MTLLWRRFAYAVYAASLGVSIAVWFIAIRAPLRMDETGSFWQISDGIAHIWSRQDFALALPVYYYILWFSTKVLGTSEIALRIPSIIAMLAAAYLFYLVGRELFGRETGIIGAVLFCLNPIVVFEAIDARAYAFALLMTNATILLLLRTRNSDSIRLAASFGFASVGILYFQLIFAAILPAIFTCFIAFKVRSGKDFWPQCSAAFIAFTMGLVPFAPLLAFMFRSANSHVAAESPRLIDLIGTLAPGGILAAAIAAAILIAIAASPMDRKTSYPRWELLFCGSIALIPALILFAASYLTSVHVFVPRYCLVAVPGIALCWAMLLSSFRSHLVRAAFCASFVALWVLYYAGHPLASLHGGSWKGALQAAEANASSDNATILICSVFPESDYSDMSLEVPGDSFFFAPLSYYRLSVPVVPLPRSLNAEAIRVGTAFLRSAELRRARFLAIGTPGSYGTLEWLAAAAAGTYRVRTLGVYDPVGLKVVEFRPRIAAVTGRVRRE